MSSHTIVNLKDVKDSAVDFGLSPDLETRFARGDLECEQVGISYQALAPGVRQPFAHKHVSHEELYVVVAGTGRVLLDGETHDLRQWDVVRVAPQTLRSFEAGPDGLTFLAVGPKGSDPAEMPKPEWPD